MNHGVPTASYVACVRKGRTHTRIEAARTRAPTVGAPCGPHGIVCSMSRRGNCWDNAVAESFFATLKVELGHEASWAPRGQARGEVPASIEQFYNGQRRHSALGYLSPLTFERRWVREGGTTATVASQPVSRWSPETTSSVAAPGATRTRGAAISVSPLAPSVTPITSIPGILETAPRTPVGTRAACLITP